jgi:hypothetical protein
MRTLILTFTILMTLTGCAGWVVFGHTIEADQPAPAAHPAVAPPSAATQSSTTTPASPAQPAGSTPSPPSTPVPAAHLFRAVTVTFTPAASEKIAAEPQFKQDSLLATIEDQLRAHGLLDSSDPHASGTLEISIDDFATRPASNAVVFGYILGNGTLAGRIEIHTADGKALQDSRIKAESRVDKPVGPDQANPFGPLYRKFADLTVDTLGST